jgi:hypothetical protein
MPSLISWEALEASYSALKLSIQPQKDELEKRLREGRPITDDEENWLNFEGNLCEEAEVMEALKNKENLSHAITQLPERLRSTAEKLLSGTQDPSADRHSDTRANAKRGAGHQFH